MNRQEIFNRVAKHLIDQSAKAQSSGTCRYRVKAGDITLMCAIGCLIDGSVYREYDCGNPDDPSYTNQLEGKPVEYKIVNEALTKSGIDLEAGDNDFLRDLQEIHDHSKVALWGAKLTEFARQYKLKLPYPL